MPFNDNNWSEDYKQLIVVTGHEAIKWVKIIHAAVNWTTLNSRLKSSFSLINIYP